ncbi:MAG: SDR family NAD(P)-dependent oxidoreductase [Terriglobales bacterium]|jgi:NAD(P)-dependent dehydrogenase (short-subunit alcohol dehydrogenase family)
MTLEEKSPFSGQVAVVTGGSGGIGTAIVDALHHAGARAISLDVSPPQNRETPWIKSDVRDDASVAAAIAEVTQKHGRINLAIHAAGVSRENVVWKLAVEDWDFIHAVNLRGAFLLLRHTIPVMRRGTDGRIVLIGSINGSRGKFGTSAYSASKAGLLGLAKSVAREVGRFGILINVVEPGWVRTRLTEALPKEIRDAAVAESPLCKLLEPSDVAAAVLFLCGPGASHITGQILRVDGGQYLGAY